MADTVFDNVVIFIPDGFPDINRILKNISDGGSSKLIGAGRMRTQGVDMIRNA